MAILVKILPLLLLTLTSCRNGEEKAYCHPPAEYKDKDINQIIKEAREVVKAPHERKAISLSLFGKKKLYNQGLIENVQLASAIYPGWDVIVFMDPSTVPANTIEQASKYGAKIFLDKKYSRASSRFHLINMSYDRFISRDADSRFTIREMVAVADWMKQDWAIVHGMRDQIAHTNPMLAGMWGGRPPLLREKLEKRYGTSLYRELMNDFVCGEDEVYGDDELFLRYVILPAVGVESFLSHETVYCDAFPGSRGFPIRRGVTGNSIGKVVRLGT